MMASWLRACGWASLLTIGCSSGSGGGGGGGSGGGSATRFQYCDQLWSATCGRLIECKVYLDSNDPSQGTFSSSACTQARDTFLDRCTTDPDYVPLETASSSDVQACADQLANYPCTEICGKVPQDPPACQALVNDPNTTQFECAP